MCRYWSLENKIYLMMKSTKASTKSHDSHHTKTAPVDVQKLENLESFQQTLLNSGPNLIVIAFYSAWSVPSIKMNKELDYMQADYSDGKRLFFIFSEFLQNRCGHKRRSIRGLFCEADANIVLHKAWKNSWKANWA